MGSGQGKFSLAIRTTWVSIAGNLVLALIKWTVGYFGNSYALIADAIESSTDVFASILVLIGLHYASRPADDDHPYGHGRAEVMATFMVVGFLVVSALFIAHESVNNIQTPHELPAPYTLVVLGLIIVWKELSYRWVRKRGDATNSTSVKADAWHHRSDAITSFAAFIGIAIALWLGPGYESADDWAALLASGFIIYNAYLIFRPALGEMMDEHVHDALVDKIRSESLKVKGVVATEKCHIRKTGMHYYVDLHAVVDAKITVAEGHKISHDLQDHLLRELPDINRVLVHIEPDQHIAL